MKTAVYLTVGVMVLSAMVMTGRAEAATANGPYYAEPSWDQKLDAATRFVVLLNWNSEAVLDRETGLVWEQSPITTPVNWSLARSICNVKILGHRQGWRLPTLQELASLIDADPANTGNPKLPPGHPFTSVPPNFSYWSSTGSIDNAIGAWVVDLSNTFIGVRDKVSLRGVWCVRGGQAVDPQ